MVSKYQIGDDYKGRLDQFFLANFVEEGRKVPVFITVIGTSTHTVLRKVCDPVLPNTLSYDKLCGSMTH